MQEGVSKFNLKPKQLGSETFNPLLPGPVRHLSSYSWTHPASLRPKARPGAPEESRARRERRPRSSAMLRPLGPVLCVLRGSLAKLFRNTEIGLDKTTIGEGAFSLGQRHGALSTLSFSR